MKRIQLIISLMLFAGVIGAGVWFYYSTKGAENKSSIPEILGDDVDLVMNGEVLIRELSKGKKSIEIKGRDLSYMEESGEIRLKKPRIKIWPEKGETFIIKGKKGAYFSELKKMEIRGQVRGETKDGYRLETEWLNYFTTSQLAETDAPVKISRDDFKMTGTGMKFYVENRKLDILSDVKVVIKNLGKEK
jgi:LPS export ABC transporter protein LptC